MDFEFLDEEFEYDVSEEEEYFDSSSSIEFEATPLYPDPLFIAAVTCFFCLLIFGILTKLTMHVFGPAPAGITLKQTSDQQINQQNKTGQPSWDGQCQVSSLYPPKITRWCDLITQYSTKHNLDPDLVAALIWLESGGNELAYSHSGAVGLMQVMPRDGLAASFMCANGPCFQDRPSSDELRNPENNIAFGTRYLASLLQRNGNLREALRSYGPIDAGYSYSDKVLNIFNQYKNN
jgi:hypothetical protein